MASVAEALEHVRRVVGVLHGAVRRDAIVLTPRMTAVVIGFDQCVPEGGAGVVGVGGPPEYYHCPRFVRGGTYSQASEVYSVGVVMLELLSGRLSGAQGGKDLVHVFVEDEDEKLEESLDARAGGWDEGFAGGACVLAGRCTGGVKQRPTMEEVVRGLCEGGAGAMGEEECGETELPSVEPRGRDAGRQGREEGSDGRRGGQGIAALAAHGDPASAASALVGSPAAARREGECVVCFDTVNALSAAVCSGPKRHVVCGVCFSDLVMSESQAVQASILKRKGMVYCPLVVMNACTAEPFTSQEVAMRVGAPEPF